VDTNPFVVIVALAALAVGAVFLVKQDQKPDDPTGNGVAESSATPADSSADPAPQPAPPAAVVVPDPHPMPLDEQALIRVANTYSAAYAAGANDMAKGGTRPQRAAELCKYFPHHSAKDWTGTISTLDSNNDGNGVLVVQIASGITVGTWNNAMSDFQDHTLIPAGSPIFQTASAMKQGDTVVFSGDFVASDTDCLEEKSLTLDGSMTSPEFVFKFRALSTGD
jgi:hypothetical protein